MATTTKAAVILQSGGENVGVDVMPTGTAHDVTIGGTGLSTIAADQMLYTSALDTLAATSLTAFGRSLMDDADAATARATLGLGTASVEAIGTSGATVGLLSTANTHTLAQIFSAGVYIGGGAADNLLDAYDKDLNWLPVLSCATPGDLTVAYTTQVGRARQLGNRVDFNLRISTSTFTHTTAAGNVTISLPTTSEGTAGNISTCITSLNNWTAPANYTQVSSKITASSAVIDLKRISNTGLALGNLDITELTSGTVTTIEISGSMEV